MGSFSAAWRAAALGAAFATLAVGAAAQQQPADVLFNTPHLAAVAPGSTLRYDHTRASDPALGLGPDLNETIAVDVGQGVATRFVMDADGTPRPFPVNQGVPGNPLLMVMLENALRATAKATGGSPFYLRNRIREAMGEQLAEAGPGVYAVRPFATASERGRMGAFADMELRFEVRPDAPGMLVALSAQAGDSYREEIRLDQDG